MANNISSTDRIRGQDGTLSLLIAVPLTRDGEKRLDPGWFQMASALLAVDHFNSRNGSVVADLSSAKDCNITFGDVMVVDTGTTQHFATHHLTNTLLRGRNQTVDAIVGPYNEIPALELSVLATAMQSPLLALRALDTTQLLLDANRHPYFHLLSADFQTEMLFVTKFLRHIHRTDFVAVLYGSENVAEIQKVDILRSYLSKNGYKHIRTFPYKVNQQDQEAEQAEDDEESHHLSPFKAMQGIKTTGYRTIVFLPNSMEKDIVALGQAAKQHGLDQGDHVWIITGGIHERSPTETIHFLSQTPRADVQFLKGSAFLFPTDDNDEINFTEQYLEYQPPEFVQRVEQQFNPIPNFLNTIIASNNNNNNKAKYSNLSSLLEQEEFPIQTIAKYTGTWMPGSSYIYDAVLSVGLGACKAISSTATTNTSRSTAMTGKMHLDGIRSTVFVGASGKMEFGNGSGNGDKSPGSRMSNTITFGVVNLLPPILMPKQHEYDDDIDDDLFRQVEQYNPQKDEWIYINSMVYGNGKTSPPPLLRDEPEMNFLSPKIRAVGLTLMTIGLLLVGLSSFWVYLHRHHSVVVAAQPAFLYSLCFGAAMVVFVIWLTSFDESYDGWDDPSKLSKICVAGVWFDALGHMLTFSALFTKLWRVNRCMRYKTRQVEVWRVMWPCAILFLLVIVLLSVWTATEDFVWVRKTIDETTGETIGRCEGDNAALYIAPVYILHFVPTVLAGIMAYKTSGMDDLYSEAKWVLVFILVQFQVLFVGVPVVLILQEITSNARFLSYSLLVFTFPVTTTGLIILPKVLTVRRMTKMANVHTSMQADSGDGQVVTTEATQATRNSNDPSPADTAAAEAAGAAASSPPQELRHGPRIQVVTFD